MKTKIIVLIQVAILAIVVIGLFALYPRAQVNVNGNFVKFNSINAKVIVMSENPDFINPRYLDLNEIGNVSFNLKPGTYYWKSDNGIIEGMKNEFTINSEVGLAINRTENESDLVNVGNVKINVTKGKEGIMVGHIILEPEQDEKIDDAGENYTGRQG
jgi:hypothetical protein